MIYAIVMAGGKGTRLKVPFEKPIFKFKDKFLIEYVLNNLSNSTLIDEIIIAVSPNTPKTRDFCKSYKNNLKILDTPGDNYLDDLSFILEHFSKKSLEDTLLLINADLPCISTETIDYVLNEYLRSDKDALSTLVPVEIFNKFKLNYSYDFNGLVPSGLNVLRSENIVQDEIQIVIPKVELAININSLGDVKAFENIKKSLLKL